MTREEFIEGYCKRLNRTPEKVLERRVALPCVCGTKECEGWAMIPNNADSVNSHNLFYAPAGTAKEFAAKCFNTPEFFTTCLMNLDTDYKS